MTKSPDMVLVALEARADGSIVIHPPAPATPQVAVNAQSLYDAVQAVLADDQIPTVHTDGSPEAQFEHNLTEGVREALPPVFKPFAGQAVSGVRQFLQKFQRKPWSHRAPIGRRR